MTRQFTSQIPELVASRLGASIEGINVKIDRSKSLPPTFFFSFFLFNFFLDIAISTKINDLYLFLAFYKEYLYLSRRKPATPDREIMPPKRIKSAAQSRRKPFEKIALCFSGGGYRAAAFHIETLTYLKKINMFEDVTLFFTVSGETLAGSAIRCWNLSSADTGKKNRGIRP